MACLLLLVWLLTLSVSSLCILSSVLSVSALLSLLTLLLSLSASTLGSSTLSLSAESDSLLFRRKEVTMHAANLRWDVAMLSRRRPTTPTSYLRMLVGYGGVAGWTDGRSDKREFYALHGIIVARSGSPQL